MPLSAYQQGVLELLERIEQAQEDQAHSLEYMGECLGYMVQYFTGYRDPEHKLPPPIDEPEGEQ